MDAEQFEERTGRKPEQDDMDRVNCAEAGQLGHWSCGWCERHDKPAFECGCLPYVYKPKGTGKP